MGNPERTVTKAREAITAATAEEDDKTVYQALGLLGLALLDLHQDEETVRVLGEIEKMVTARRRIVVGDETLFLERLFAQTKADTTKNAIQEIARILWRVCREPAFADRLRALANA
jgi:gamma-glutamyltranspeptidase